MSTNPAEVNEHVSLIIAVAIPTASAVMAWAGVKFGLKGLVKEVVSLKESDEKIIADLKLVAKEKAEKAVIDEIKRELDDIQHDLCLKVPMNTCMGERKDCHQDRISLNCEMSKQITLLVSAMNVQDEKRQALGDKNHDMLMKIMEKISSVELAVGREISEMKTIVMTRESRFRKPTPEELSA